MSTGAFMSSLWGSAQVSLALLIPSGWGFPGQTLLFKAGKMSHMTVLSSSSTLPLGEKNFILGMTLE